jgi:predicted RNA-binding Zn-ribbon protein involved in translation (DUF1610 family)
MDTKATNVNLTVDYTCPACGVDFHNVQIPFSELSCDTVPSGWSDVDDGWSLYKWFHNCPKCGARHMIEIHRENP